MSEQQNIEWKESWRDEYLKWICAFCNTKGGILIIGKRDDGSIKGIENSKKLMTTIPDKIINALGITCEVNLKVEDELEYIEIVVEQSKLPTAFDGRYYVRVGSTTRLLTGTALANFMLKMSNMDWEEVAMPYATIDDIDVEAINAFKVGSKASGRVEGISDSTTVESVLRNLNLFNSVGNLKRAAIILFGKDPQSLNSSAYLKIGRFGESNSELLSQDEVKGNAFQLADKTLEILDNKYFVKSITYDRLQRIETPAYPYKAIREILFNAIIHRLYETSAISIRVFNDRLVIWNIGGLPEKLSIEDLKHQHDSYPRNPLIAGAFYKGGHIEAWGRGTITIIEECRKHGLIDPLIEERGGGISITLFKDKTSPDFLATLDLNERQLKAIEYVKEIGFITNGVYQEKMNTSSRSALRDLDNLVALNVFKKEGDNKGSRYILN